MREDCMDCSKWAENIYWSRFHPLHFCQILPRSFAQQLAIPQKFANNLREKLAGVIVLRGPSGGTWDVGLITDGDELLMKHGWKEFAKEHSLQENAILIFKYNGCSRFDVLIFDQENMCEKEISYFVKKCAHTERAPIIKQKRSSRESPEDTDESSDDDVAENRRVKYRRAAAATSGSTSRRQPASARVTPRGRRGIKRGKRGSGIKHPMELKSNRREVTDEEKEKAKQKALAASSKNSFLVVMRASHVYKGFYMSIPSEWAKHHLPRKSKNVELRNNGKTWPARYFYRGYGGGLCGGWRSFVLDHFLEEFDVCVFDLVNGTADVPILDIKIVRVLEEVIKPSPLTRSAATENGKSLTKYSTGTSVDEDE